MSLPQFQIQFDSLPNPEAVVSGPNVRFSLLTDPLEQRIAALHELSRKHQVPAEELPAVLDNRMHHACWCESLHTLPSFLARLLLARVQ